MRSHVRMTLAAAAITAAVLEAQSPPATPLAQAVAEVEAAEAGRHARDEAAWKRVAPEFMFGHNTGEVVDLATYRASLGWRNPTSALPPILPSTLEPPVDRLVRDVLVRWQLQAFPGPPGTQPQRMRLLDVYYRRDGHWEWLAHQTSVVEPPRKAVALERAILDEYAGSYLAPDGSTASFTRRDDGLVETSGGQGGAQRLVALSEATFGYEGRWFTVTFVRNRNGQLVAADRSTSRGFVRLVRTEAAR